MLFQPTNIIPDMRTGIGFGTVDVNNGLQVSWQVNGDYPVMTAFAIAIYANDATSTQPLYTTNVSTAGCPFYGRDATGEAQVFSYTIPDTVLATAGITNGNEYKMYIRQFYTENDGTTTSTLQSSASVFLTRTTPSFDVVLPLINYAEQSFEVVYYQEQGDPLEWIRYQIQTIDGGNAVTIYDSGNIYGPTVLRYSYSGFISGQSYVIRATGQTSNGVQAESSAHALASYSQTTPTGSVTAECANGYDAVKVSWDTVSTGQLQTLWVLYRQQPGQNTVQVLQHLGVFPKAQTSAYDFGAASGQGPYRYLLFQARYNDNGDMQYLSSSVTSDPITPLRYYWSLLECAENQDGIYRVLQEFDFKNNLDSGSISNNNSPSVLQNFTAFPTVQLSPSNYKSGTLNALVGKAVGGVYSGDTLALRDAIMALSTSQNTLFLKSSKGDVMMVAINGAISVSISDTVKEQPQAIAVPWIEIDNSPFSILAYPGDALFSV